MAKQKMFFKNNLVFLIIISIIFFNTIGCKRIDKINKQNNNVLKIFNWGQFIDPKVLYDFEKKYDVKIVYDTYDSNESMYRKIASGTVNYDLVFPSDYMCEKLIKENLVEKINYSLLSNFKNINPYLLNQKYDKNQEYTVPYFWGTVGIIYNKEKINIKESSWNILWNEEYKNNILMYYSLRDTLMIGLKKNGFSMNTNNEEELKKATKDLIQQKNNILGYVGDEVITNMINDQADIAVVYSGDATAIMKENKKMEYIIPTKEGTNIWIDNICMLKNSNNKILAHKFLDYLCDVDVSKNNTNFVGYSTPNIFTMEQLINEEVEEVDWPSYNPDIEKLDNLESFSFLTNDILKKYNYAWEEILNS